jgi:NDP-sugar pyrophosphorylase family protein
MQPLSFGRSKTMLPFLGRPLLYYLVSHLRAAGFEDLVFSNEGRAGDIRSYFGDGDEQSLRIRYMPPGIWDGSAGVVAGWLDHTGPDTPDTLIVIYGDSLLQADLGRFLSDHRSSGASVSVLAHRARFEKFLFRDDARRTNYGVIDFEADGKIGAFKEKAFLSELPRFRDPWANAAVYAFDREILKRIKLRKPGESDFGSHLFPSLLQEGVRFHAVDIGDGYRLDVGTLDLYLTAQMAALRGLVACDPGFPTVAPYVWCDQTAVVGGRSWSSPTVVGPNAQVAPSARLDHAIICAGAVVEAGAVIDHSVILDRARVDSGVTIRRSVIGFGCHVGNGAGLLEDSVLGELSEVGTRSRLMPDEDLLGLLGRDDK